MIKVIIADDENKIRQVIKKLIPWESLGLSLVGECTDGDELLQQVQKLQPQIVLSDMRMPGVHGAELLSQLRQWNESLNIIVLSGYDKFAFMRQAVMSGAIDYLMKPIVPDELVAALQKAIGHCQKQEVTQSQLRFLEQKQYVKKLYLNQVSEYETFYENLGFSKFPNLQMFFALLSFYELDGRPCKEVVATPIINMLEKSLQGSGILAPLQRRESSFVMLLTMDAAAHQCDMLQSCVAQLQNHPEICFLLSAGVPRNDPSELHLSYGEAMVAFTHFPIGAANVISVYEETKTINTAPVLDEETEHLLRLFAQKGNVEKFRKELSEFYCAMSRADDANLLRLRKCNERIIPIVSLLLYHIQAGSAFHNTLEHIHTALAQMIDPGTCCMVLSDFLNTLPIHAHIRGSERQTVAYQVRKYLQAHYCEKIGLQQLADQFYLTKPYISKMFKEEFSVSIFDYIDILRIESAKERLAGGQTVREITEALGYYDESHFDRKFKKITGISPKDYRK